MASLPWDIVVNILCRLPVKDLLRYRCVSKQWCLLIDGHDFIKMHLKISMETRSNFGIVISGRDLYWVPLDVLDSAVKLHPPIGRQGDGTALLGSCHGLLALLSINGDVALWNPSTRRYRKLPISGIEFPAGILYYVQFIVYGFGYDPISDDYKLVRIVQFLEYETENSFRSEVKVYSAKSNTWKRIKDFPHYLLYPHCFGFGVLVNNALHWVASSDVSNFVVALDLVTEEYREVPLPDFKGVEFRLNVEVLDGSLCLICNFISKNKTWDRVSSFVDMWVMKEYGDKESWTKLCTVVPDVSDSFCYVYPVACLESVNQVLMNKNGEQFISYDLKNEEYKDGGISGAPRDMATKLCVESLVGLDDNDGPFGWNQGEEDRKMMMMKKNHQKQRLMLEKV